MFNYLKKYNIFCSLKLFVVLYAVCMFSISAEAKICFLPDSSCGTGKISSVKPSPSQCLYSSMAQAQNGISSCEKAYKQNFCFYRRCKTEDNNIFADEASCKKKAKADNLICVSCGGCYKVTSKTCPSGYTAGLTTCAEKAGYTASYSSNGYAGYSVCGKCKYTIKPCESGYTVGLASCPEKQGYTSDYSRNGVSGEQVCGKCDYTAKGCASGYTAGLTSCSERRGYNASYASNGYAGELACGKCSYTAKGCAGGYTAGLTSCSERRGYNASYASNGYAGELACGKCSYTAKGCAGGYTAGLTSCSERRGYNASYASNGYSGEKICGKCDYTARTCPDGYSTKYSSVSACGNTGSNGWNYYTNGYSGKAVCGQCKAKACPSGYYKLYSSVKSCGSTGSEGWNYSTNGYSGNMVCGKCASKTCPSGYTCASYKDDLLKEQCNTSTRCPGNSGYYTSEFGGNSVIITNRNCDYGFWAHPAGRCGDGICLQYGRRTCPNGGISKNEVSSPDSYCKNKYATSRWDKLFWWAKFMENSDGTYMCSGTEICQECYRD